MSDDSDPSNVCTVLFVLGLVYSAIIILMFARTWKRMTKCGTKDHPLRFDEKIWKVFYAFTWA